MGEILVFLSASGGVGKTALAANIGAALAAESRVLLVDACVGRPSLDLFTGVEDSIIYDCKDVLEGNCRIAEAIREIPEHPGLYLLPAPSAGGADALPPEKLGKLLGLFRDKFDFVLVDLPNAETNFRNTVLSMASRFVAVVTCSRDHVRNMRRLLKTLPEGKKRSLLVNMVRTELVKDGEVLSIEEVVKLLQVPLLGAVRFDTDFYLRNEDGSLSIDEKEPVGRAFRNICRRLAGEDVPVDLRGKH